METRSRSKEKNSTPLDNGLIPKKGNITIKIKQKKQSNEYNEEDSCPIYPMLSKDSIDQLKGWPGAVIEGEYPIDFTFTSEAAFLSIIDDTDPQLLMVWDSTLPIGVRIELANICYSFWHYNGKISNPRTIALINYNNSRNLQPFFEGQFRHCLNIGQVFTRIHDAYNLPALSQIPEKTYLAHVRIIYQNSRITFSLAR